MGRKKKEQLYYPNGEKKPRNIPFLNWLFFLTCAPLFIMPIILIIKGEGMEPLLVLLSAVLPHTIFVLIYLFAFFVSSTYVMNRLYMNWANEK